MNAWLLLAAAWAVEPEFAEPVDVTAPLDVDPGPVGPVADEPAPPAPPRRRPAPPAPEPAPAPEPEPEPIAWVGPPTPAPTVSPPPDPPPPPIDPSPLGRQLGAEALAIRDLIRPLPLLWLAALAGLVALARGLARRLDRAGYGASRIMPLLRWVPALIVALWLAGAALRSAPVLGVGLLLILGVPPARVALERVRLPAAAPPPRVTIDHLPAGDAASIRRIALLCPWIRAGTDVVVEPRGPGVVAVTLEAWSPAAAREADAWLRARL